MNAPRSPRLSLFVLLQLLAALRDAEARHHAAHYGGVLAHPWWRLESSSHRPAGLFLVHARDGVSSRAVASVGIHQQDSACSGGGCSLIPMASSASESGNSTSPQSVRGGSTRTAQDPQEETSELRKSANSSTELTDLNISDVTAAIPRRDELSEGAVDSQESIAPSGEESNAKQLAPHHQETRKEKRQRLKRHKQIAKQLKNRNARNMRRKVLHACFGLTFAGLNHWLPKTTFVPCMALLSSATLVMELLRYRKGFGWMNAALHGVLGQSLRKHEMEGKFTGSFYFFTGVTLTSWLFDSTSATLGICQLALADPSASYFGRKTRHIYWSRIENGLGGFGRNKGVLGFLGGAFFCFPFNYRVLYVAAKHSKIAGVGTATTPVIVAASLALGLAGAFADLAVPTPALVLPKKILGVRVPPFHVDDNMVVPIFSAFACREIFRMLQLSQLELSRWVVI